MALVPRSKVTFLNPSAKEFDFKTLEPLEFNDFWLPPDPTKEEYEKIIRENKNLKNAIESIVYDAEQIKAIVAENSSLKQVVKRLAEEKMKLRQDIAFRDNISRRLIHEIKLITEKEKLQVHMLLDELSRLYTNL